MRRIESCFEKLKAAATLSMMLFVVCGEVLAQDAGAVLRNVGRTTGFAVAAVQQRDFPVQNSWTAYYRTPGFQPVREMLGDLSVSLYIYSDARAANWGFDQSDDGTPVSANRHASFDGRRLHVWDRYGVRLLHQVDIYLVNISLVGRQRDERWAMRVLESVVRELKSLGPKPQIIRARDVPDPERWTLTWGAQAAFVREQNFAILPWEEAMQIFLGRELKGGKQYRTAWLTIFCANGDSFLTQQPELDAYIRLSKARSITLTGFTSE